MTTQNNYKHMKITFYFKASQSPTQRTEGLGFIYYYIIINSRKSPEKTTKIKCHRDEFDSVKGYFVGNDADKRNKRLAQITEMIERNKLIKEALGDEVSVETIEISNEDKRLARTFNSVFKEYLGQQSDKIRKEGQVKHKGNIEQSTYETYEKREKNIEKFLKSIKRVNLTISQFDERMCELLDNYLTSKLNFGQAYATKHIKLVRTVCELARRSNIIKVNFTENYKLKHESEKKVKTLTSIDYKQVEENVHLLNPHEMMYWDMFIFMRETFMHHADYMELNESHIQKDAIDRLWIIKPRKKRFEEERQIQMIPLSSIALKIVEKYEGVDNLPKRNLTSLNKMLKFIFFKLGIEKKVSSKKARSSGISLSFNERRVRGESIAVVAGWTSTRELKNYLEIDTLALSREFLREAD